MNLSTTPSTNRKFIIWFIVPLMVFLSVHFVLRMSLSNSLEPDDADLALFGQTLAWGYSDQGPLYAWMVWAAFKVFGTGIFALTLVRMIVLASIFVFLYSITFKFTRNWLLSVLAAFSPMLVPTFSWHAVSYLTHTNLLCAVTLATVYQTIRVRENGSIGNYLLLGFVVGLGGLTKYNYLIAAVGLVTAALMVMPYRRTLLSWRLSWSVIVAAVIVFPHLLWLNNYWGQISTELAQKTGVGYHSGLTWATLRGFAELLQNLVLIPLILLFFFAVCFPLGLKRRTRDIPDTPSREGARLIEWFAVGVLAWMVIQLTLGGHRIHERWLQPYFLLLPVYLFTRLVDMELNLIRIRRYAWCLGMCALAVTVTRFSQNWLGARDDGVYPMQLRFDATANQIRDQVGDFDMILGADREIAGNLKHCFPDKRVLCTGRPACQPPRQTDELYCLFVWNAVYGDEFPIHLDVVQAHLPEGGQVVKSGVLELPPQLPNRHTNRLGYHLIDLGDETSRASR